MPNEKFPVPGKEDPPQGGALCPPDFDKKYSWSRMIQREFTQSFEEHVEIFAAFCGPS
jgi:hypothetical protein